MTSPSSTVAPEPDEVRPFRIWSGLLRSAVRQLGDIDPAEIVGGDGPTLSRLLPELTRRMGLPAPGPTSDLESERQALFGAVMRMIGRFSARATDADHPRRPALGRPFDTAPAGQHGQENPLRSILAVGIYRDTELPPESHLPETLSQLRRRFADHAPPGPGPRRSRSQGPDFGSTSTRSWRR